MAEIESFLLSPFGIVQMGSFFVLISYMVKDFFMLRLSLIFANVFFLIPIIYNGDSFLASGVWSVLFMMVNAQRIWVMYIESRPAKLNEAQEMIYLHLFRHMKPKQFLRVYKLGRICEVENGGIIINKGQNVQHLRVILSGVARVITPSSFFYLGEGQLIGEMGFLTRTPASADVIALESISYMEWSRVDLKKEYIKQSQVEHSITAAIGNDLIRKLQAPKSEYLKSVSSPDQGATSQNRNSSVDSPDDAVLIT